ncbi:MAG TPA: gamma-glutamyltransferase [Caulobacteraceae bacterium]|jgi:gamma-glutamyltranspeptidase/glutathione hydrolase
MTRIDLSPAAWPAGARQAAEALEAARVSPTAARIASGRAGVISAMVSPIAVEAGLQALSAGGSAADAAATVALTQITTLLGSVVSFAGILTLLYFEAATGEVHSLDGAWNSYRGETDAKSIPASDLGPLSFAQKPTAGADGRKTLVGGFMAALEAMHRRFGRLAWADLFGPAIAYAEGGVTVSEAIEGWFGLRARHLAKTKAGVAFLGGTGRARPVRGDVIRQPDLAGTLGAVASQGARHMYEGAWAEAFVATVREAGGAATLEDLAAYEPVWSQPESTEVFGHTVFAPGAPNTSDYVTLCGLDLAEALQLDRRGPCWDDPLTFRDLTRISQFVTGGPYLRPQAIELLLDAGVDVTMNQRRGTAFAKAAAASFDKLYAPPPGAPRHSCSVVVVDADGNVAALTHTINTVVWGDTGLIVGGVPLPDPAGIFQGQLAMLTPGARLPNDICCVMALRDGRPTLATAPIGSSLHPETLKALVATLAQGRSQADAAAAPPLLGNFDAHDLTLSMAERPAIVPEGAYADAFLEAVRAAGLPVKPQSAQQALALRGTLACVSIDADMASAPEAEGVMVYAGSV